MKDQTGYLCVDSGVRARRNFDSWFIYKTSRFLRYETNEVGIHLLRMCNGLTTMSQALKQASEKIGIEKSVAFEFLSQLMQEGIVKVVSSPRQQKVKIFDDIGPSWVVLHITNQCNLKCQHCYVNASSRRFDVMPIETVKSVLSQLEAIGTIDVIVTGGEPTIHPQFAEVMNFIKQLGMSSEILTNGTLIDQDVAHHLADIGVTQVLVSLDSSVPSIHDKLRGVKGAWKSAVQGIRNLKNAGVKIIANTVIYRHNLDDLPNMFSLLSDLSVDVWRLGTLFYVGRAANNQKIKVSVQENMKVLQHLDDLYMKGNWSFMLSTTLDWEALAFSDDELAERRHFCGMTMGKHLYIRANGDVLVCDRLPNLIAGNIYKETISDIWGKDIIKRWKIHSRVEEIPDCAACKWKYLCGAGCRANAYRFGDGYFSPDPIACASMVSLEENWDNIPTKVQNRLQLYISRAENTGATNDAWLVQASSDKISQQGGKNRE